MTEDMGASVGWPTPVGSDSRASRTRSATTCRARNASTSQSNSAHTMDMPMPDWLRSRRTPGAPCREVSTGTVTSDSTSSGAIPCASVITVTVGAVTSGRTSMAMREAVQAP